MPAHTRAPRQSYSPQELADLSRRCALIGAAIWRPGDRVSAALLQLWEELQRTEEKTFQTVAREIVERGRSVDLPPWGALTLAQALLSTRPEEAEVWTTRAERARIPGLARRVAFMRVLARHSLGESAASRRRLAALLELPQPNPLHAEMLITQALWEPQRRGARRRVGLVERAAVRCGDRRMRGLALWALSRCLRETEADRHGAELLLRQATALFELTGFRAAEGWAHLDWGILLARSDPQRALAETEQARLIQAEIGAWRHEGRAQLNLAAFLTQGGRHDEAIEAAERALHLQIRAGDRLEHGRALDRLAVLFARVGDLSRAREMLREALTLQRELGNRAEIAKVSCNLAGRLHDSGQSESARELLLPFVTADDDDPALAPLLPRILLNLAACEQVIGQRRQTIPSHLTRALAIAERRANSADVAVVHAQLGAHYHETPEPGGGLRLDLAHAHYELALRAYRQCVHRPREGWILGTLALVLADLGREREARLRFAEAITLSLQLRQRRDEARQRLNQGLAAVRNDWPADQDILDNVYRAIALLEAGLDPCSLAEGLLVAGILEWRGTSPRVAQQRFGAAFDLLDAHLLELASPLVRRVATDDLGELLARAIELLAGAQPAVHDVLFRALERFRCRVLLDEASAPGALIPHAAGPSLPTTIRNDLGVLRARLWEVEGQADTALMERLRKRLEDKRQELSDQMRALEVNQPFFTQSAGMGRSLTLAELQQSGLRDGEALLLTRVLPHSTLLLFVDRTHTLLHVAELGGVDLARAVERLRAHMSLTGRKGYSSDTMAYPLYANLLLPLASSILGCGRLFVVADGVLSDLPLGLLPTQAQDLGLCLGDQIDLCRVESASLLAPPPGQSPTLDYLGIGDPSSPFVRHLPQTSQEISASAAHFADPVVLRGQDATKANYLRHAPGARYIHLAAHATPDFDHPALSAVHLTPGTGEDDDGELQAHEIRACRLSARLVVLSACETALGERSSSEGVLGLARAFRAAGADTVLATVWPVHDRAMALLTIFFFQEIAAAPQAHLSTCLRRATAHFRNPSAAELAEDPARREFRHPYFWAGAVLLGSGR